MKFDISSNGISVDGTKLFAEELRGNQIMTELNISSNRITDRAGYQNCNDMSGVTALVGVIPGMGALSTFTFSGDYDSGPFTMETTMTEADFSGKKLGVSGGMMVAAFLPKCQ